MSESIDSMRRATLEVVDLPTDRLDPDPANPNHVDSLTMAALRRTIERDGFVQPVVVRPAKKGRYTIVDGEHRWIVLRDAGSDTTPCVIDDAGDDEGRMRLLTMNALRGRPNPEQRAKVLAHLASLMDPDELRERLGMDEDDLDAALAFKDVSGDLDERLAAHEEAEEKAAPVVLRWRMGPRQAKAVEKALEAALEDGQTSRADALAEVLR